MPLPYSPCKECVAVNRPLKIILWILGSLVGLVLLAIVLAYLFFPSEKVRRMAEEKASSALNRRTTIEEVSLSLWPLGVKATGVTIANDPEFGDEPLFSLERLVVAVNTSQLLFHWTVQVDEVLIERPRISLSIREDGRSNFADLFARKEEAAPPDTTPVTLPTALRLKQVRLVDGRVSYRDAQAGFEAGLDSLNETVRLDIDRDLRAVAADGRLEIGSVRIASGGQAIGPLALQVDHHTLTDLPSDSTAYRVGVNLGGLQLTFVGRVREMSTRPDVLVDLVTEELDVPSILKNIPASASPALARTHATGRILLKLHLHTVIDTTLAKPPLTLNGRIALRDISLRNPDLPKAIDSIGGDIAFTEDSISIRDLIVRASQTNISVNALLHGWQTDAPILDHATLEANLRLDELADIVALPESTAVGGRVGVRLRASGPVKTPMEMDVRGEVALNDVRVETPLLKVPIRRINGEVEISRDLVSIRDIGVWAGQSEIHLEQTRLANYLSLALPEAKPAGARKAAPKASASFTVRAPLLNVDELIDIQLDTSALADTTVLFALSPFPPIDVSGQIQVGRLIIYKLALTNLRSTVQLAGQRGSLNAGLDAYTGHLDGGGWVDVSDTSDVRYAWNWDAREVEANDFLTALTRYKDRFHGKVTTNGQMEGHGNTYGEFKQNLNGEFRGRAGDGYLRNWPVVQRVSVNVASGVDRIRSGWGTTAVGRMGIDRDTVYYGGLDGVFRIREGKLIVENVGFVVKEQNWRTDGWISLSGPMELTTQLTFSEPLTLDLAEGAVAAVSAITAGRAEISTADLAAALEPPNRLRVSMPIRGTASNPDVGMPDLLEPFQGAARKAIAERASQVRERVIDEAKERVRSLFRR